MVVNVGSNEGSEIFGIVKFSFSLTQHDEYKYASLQFTVIYDHRHSCPSTGRI